MERDNRRLYSSMRFEGDGVTKVVALTFELREGDSLSVDFGYGLVESGYIIDYDSQPVLIIFDEPLPKQTITIRRLTQISEVPHVFQKTGNAQGGSPFNAKNIDENFENITRASQDAMDSQVLASETLEEMSGIRDDAIGYRDEAEESARKARESEDSSRISASASLTGATASAQSASKAEGHELKAKAWATNPENVEVEGGKYSAYHWAVKAKESVGFDIEEYRKLDDNIFNGYLQVRSGQEGQGTGVSLQDTDGTVRGQVIATDQGLQLTQYPKDGGSQTFTFPGEGGEIEINSGAVIYADRDFGVEVGEDSGDQTNKLKMFLDKLRETDAVGVLPYGVINVSGIYSGKFNDQDVNYALDISGVHLVGGGMGHRGAYGTILNMSGEGFVMFQKETNSPNIKSFIHNIATKGGTASLVMRYSVHSEFVNINWSDCDHGIILGDPALTAGCLSNRFTACSGKSHKASLQVLGKQWNNGNLFTKCFFTGDEPSIINVTGGYGAISNTFIGTEFDTSDTGGVGLEMYKTMNTSFINGYFECWGSAVRLLGSNFSVKFDNCLYGTTKNNRPDSPPAFIHHSADGIGRSSIHLIGGTVITSTVDMDNMKLLWSDNPSNLEVNYISEVLKTGSGKNFKIFDEEQFFKFKSFKGNYSIEGVPKFSSLTLDEGYEVKQIASVGDGIKSLMIHIRKSEDIEIEKSGVLSIYNPFGKIPIFASGNVNLVEITNITRIYLGMITTSPQIDRMIVKQSSGLDYFRDVDETYLNSLKKGSSITINLTWGG